MSFASRTLLILALGAAALSSRSYGADPAGKPNPHDPAGIEFFEKKVRPVLAKHCFQCHSAEAKTNKKLKGGLYLDSRAAFLRGGDTGPALTPGDPDKSLFIEAVRYENENIAMPPKERLSAAVVADLEQWVKMGAPWPGGEANPAVTKKDAIDYDKLRKEHWAYQPVAKVQPPVVKNAAWPANDIDRFTLAKLEAQNLKPVKDADRVALVRRVYYDLIGLPPTPQQIDAFVNDASANAYEKLVDQLLASPHFGERWGRHWLDVARYAESLTLRGFVLKDTWKYRDYVIDTFNQDRPFDRFMIEQVAGDLMPAVSHDERARQMTGTTFLAMGNNNLEEQDKTQLRMDVVDEQLEAVGKAFLAQTIGCARCHDHKFDPIPTADYYALAGILRNAKTLEHSNVSKWLEVPLPESGPREAEIKKHEDAVSAMQARIAAARAAIAKAKTKDADKLPKSGKAAVVAVDTLPGVVVDDAQARRVGDWKQSTVSSSFIGDGYSHDMNEGKGEKTITFQPDIPKAGKYEVRLAYVPGPGRSKAVPVTIFSADGERTIEIDQTEAPPIDGRFVSLGQYLFEKNNQGFVLISNEGTRGHVLADAVAFIPVEELAALPVASNGAPGDAPLAADPAAAALTEAQVKEMEAELKKLTASGPKRETVIAVLEEKKIEDTKVHVRGSVHNLGPQVRRGFLTCVSVADVPAVPSDESGRLQLGQWMARPDNPLPARVMANRVWHWLMGSGIVRTVDNFGTTGEKPSHPELLDYLATQFIEDGWSVKKLVRSIVLSRTYRLSTDEDEAALAADAENRLRWRMDRRRLDAECIRDGILQVSGQLDLTPGGATYKAGMSADYSYKHTDTRRSVYSPVFRNSLPEIFEAFDFADPSMPTGRRTVSTVATQALFMLNHPWVAEQANAAAARLVAEPGLSNEQRLTRAYRLTLGREPTAGEQQVAMSFLNAAGDAPAAKQAAWGQIFHALFASVDYRYVE